ncbi:hypothetical protein C0993_002119 [Termitomyces sp. T159_Od127]|nr:hypothetical protein C0993_002119 [Termitomyces sp. T159_Od127]
MGLPPLCWAQGLPPENNGGPPPSSGPSNSRPLGGWSLTMNAFLPQCSGSNHYYYYYNAAPPPRNPNPQDNIHDVLTHEGKLDIQKPKPFYSHDSCKWRTFLTHSCVASAALYLQGIAFDHYTVLLQFGLNSLVLSNWQAFAQEFSSKFGVFDTVAEAENLFNLQMCNNKQFTTFIVHFEKEAYKTGWSYNALWFALHHTLPQCIKDVLCLAPKQPNYNSYKALVTQIDQQYWEDCSNSSTSASDITHYMQTTLTFTNGQQQDLQLLVTHLHASVPLILASLGSASSTPVLNGDIPHSTLTAKSQSA